jgi:hypothetical protein
MHFPFRIKFTVKVIELDYNNIPGNYEMRDT